jgi:hypothetical protein
LTFQGGLRPEDARAAARKGVDRARVAAVAREYGLPEAELVEALDLWLGRWAYWRRTQGERQKARDVLNKKAARARARGDEAAAQAATAHLHRGTARAARLRRMADALPAGEIADQVRARAEQALRRPPPEATEPELTRALAVFWLMRKGELPSPGGGAGKTPPNEFIRFAAACAEAVGLRVTEAVLRDRYQRSRKRVMAKLEERRTRSG